MRGKPAAIARLRRRLFPSLLAGVLAGGCLHPGPAPPWKFAVFCDGRSELANDPGTSNGVRWASVSNLATDAVRRKAALVIFPGDLANGNVTFGPLTKQWAEWKRVMAPCYDAGIAVYPIRGNHEKIQADNSVKTWTNVFSYLPQNGPDGQKGLTYKLETNNACFIGFDQYAGRTTNQQTRVVSGLVSPWVIDQIKQATNRWVFAFAHESAFFGHHVDCLASAEAERDQLWDALGEKGGVYLSGHDHMYVRRSAPDKNGNPVLELVVGCGGAAPYRYDHFASNQTKIPTNLFVNAARPAANAVHPIVNSSNYPSYFGYVLITVYGDKLEGEWWALTNYDTSHLATGLPPKKPKFAKLDSFTWRAKSNKSGPR